MLGKRLGMAKAEAEARAEGSSAAAAAEQEALRRETAQLARRSGCII